jgi:aerobic carbon-monoxide dehydrogenase medium subunit
VSFAYQAAHDLDEALTVLAESPKPVQVLAGGTDVGVQFLRGEIAPEYVLYIGGIEELRGITANGGLTLGALTTHRELAEAPIVREEFAALAEAANQVGGRQTQNAGTVGGNVANASPAADLPPALLLADARVRLASASGERTVALAEFFLARRQTARRPDELVTALILERPRPRTYEAYVKLGRRRAMEIAIVGLAMRLTFDEALAEIVDARVAVCAAAQRPYRAPDAEASLIGCRLDEETLAAAGRLAAAPASPIDDVRASAEYRRRVIKSLTVRAAQRCRSRALASKEDR